MITKVKPVAVVDTTKFDPKNGVKYTVPVPTGFEFGARKPLKKRNFETDNLFYEHKAAEMTFKADNFRVLAAEAKKHGSRADQAKAKKIVKLQEKMNELQANLRTQGVDVDALLKSLQEATKK